MGSWSAQAFGNDDALDWLSTLAKSKDSVALEHSFTECLRGSGWQDSGAFFCAIAATKVIDNQTTRCVTTFIVTHPIFQTDCLNFVPDRFYSRIPIGTAPH